MNINNYINNSNNNTLNNSTNEIINKNNNSNHNYLKLLFKYYTKFDNNTLKYSNVNMLLYDSTTINANCDFRCDNQDGFLDNTMQILSFIQDYSLSIQEFYNYITSSSNKLPFLVYDLYNFIPYDEAIQVFQLFDNQDLYFFHYNRMFNSSLLVGGNGTFDNYGIDQLLFKKCINSSLSETSRVFIALQFFIYYFNKSEKNDREYYKFIALLLLDKSPLVNKCVKYILQFIDDNHQQNNSIDNSTKNNNYINNSYGRVWLIIYSIYERQDKLDQILESNLETQSHFKDNIYNLLNYLNKNNHLSRFKCKMDQPTSSSQLKFLEIINSYISSTSEPSHYPFNGKDVKLNQFNGVYADSILSKSNNNCNNGNNSGEKRSLEIYSKNSNESKLKRQKAQQSVIQPDKIYIVDYDAPDDAAAYSSYINANTGNNDDHGSYIMNLPIFLLETIIRDLLNIDGLYGSKYQQSSINQKEKEWDSIIKETHRTILSFASVSKCFLYVLGYVFESLDWTESKVIQLIFGNNCNIGYGKEFSIISSPSKSMKYETIIKSTPFDSIFMVFSKIETMVVECKFNPLYDSYESSYITFPPKDSLISLKKLVIVGTLSFQGKLYESTAGLHIIKYLIYNSRNLEQLIFIGESFKSFNDFDFGVVRFVLDYHKHSLRVIKFKYQTISNNIKSLLNQIFQLVGTHQITIKIYESSKNNSNNYIKYDINSILQQ